MNCKECLKLLDTYFDGKLHGEMELEVREHLDSCIDCASEYRQMVIAYRIIKEEKKMQPNPFLSTRVMSHIETIGEATAVQAAIPILKRALQPLIVGVSLAAAVFTGVMIGHTYAGTFDKPEIPVEMSYMNDASMEYIDVLSVE